MIDYSTYSEKSQGMIEEKKGKRYRHTSRIFFPKWSYHCMRIVLALLFLWSGVSKLINPKSFALIIEAYGLIPEIFIMPVALALPALEVIAAIGLLMDIRGSLMIITGLMALFIAILSYGIWMGLDIDCGCFLPGDPEGEAYHGLRSALYRDFLITAGILYLYIWRYARSAKPIGLRDVTKIYLRRKNE